MKRRRGGDLGTLAFLLAPSLAGLVLFNLVPMVYSIYISLTDWDGVSKTPQFIGLKNFFRVFSEELSRNSFLTTFKFILMYVPVVLVLGLLLSLMIHSVTKGKQLYRAAVFIPVVMSWITVSFIWKWIYDPFGLLNYLLSIFGIKGSMWLGNENTALISIVVATAWKDLGFIAIILLAGLDNIPSSYQEAASIDGANALNRFFRVTLPMLTPSLFFVMVLSLINNFQVFDQIYIMTAGGPLNSTRTVVIEIFENAFSFNRMGFASAQALTLFLVILIVTGLQNWIQKRWVVYETE